VISIQKLLNQKQGETGHPISRKAIPGSKMGMLTSPLMNKRASCSMDAVEAMAEKIKASDFNQVKLSVFVRAIL